MQRCSYLYSSLTLSLSTKSFYFLPENLLLSVLYSSTQCTIIYLQYLYISISVSNYATTPMQDNQSLK